MKTYCRFLFSPLLILLLMAVGKGPAFTIFMVGDSTMANKDLTGGNPERGWGHVLPGFFSEEVRIDNHAVNGRSTKSFIDEGRWDKVIAEVRKGDYVFIQFGHNDEKDDPARHTEPGGSFNANLKRFVAETRAKGGIPVLFTSIVRRQFAEDGTLKETHGAYITETKKVATEMNVPLIDLNSLTHDWVQTLGDGPSRNYFMWVQPHTLACCPEGKQDDTHLNVAGARAVAAMAVKALSETISTFSSYIRRYEFVVAKDGSGDFFTVQDAVNAVPDYRKEARTRILIRQGEYKEKLIISESKINVSLIGEEGTVLTYNDFASAKNIFGEDKSTSGSATCYFYADNLYAEGITFRNSAGRVGQAVAVMVAGDRTVFRRCRFLGFQDTLYTYGMDSRQYYEGCHIEGTVDFIFGWSTAVFNRCTIHSVGNGYLTAPATPEGRTYGYLFLDCKLTANPGVDHVYLGRPWRNYARSVFVRCQMDAHILPVGWHNWNKPEAESTILFAEYGSTGSGAAPEFRAAFSHQLPSAAGFTVEETLAGIDGWNPLTDPETLMLEKR